MRHYFHNHTPSIHNLFYFKGNGQLSSLIKRRPLLCDALLILFSIGMAFGFYSYFRRFSEPLQGQLAIDLSPSALPQYTFFSMSRGLIAYCFSLIFSFIWGFWAAKDTLAQRFLIPILDVVQSVPVLGFMPGVILVFMGLFPHQNIGIELAAIVIMFLGEAWNIAFGVYHSIRIIPQDKIDCARVYRFSNWQRLKWLELPYTTISLVWNSIMSVASGWFFLMITEAFRLGDRDFRLPGLGSYMNAAAAEGNTLAIVYGIMAMIALIVFLNYFLWNPLIVWAQKFRVEETSSSPHAESLVFLVITHSSIIQKTRHLLCFCSNSLRPIPKATLTPLIISRIGLIVVLSLIAIGLFWLIGTVSKILLGEWLHLFYLTLLTFSRVICVVVIGTLITLPLALFIGLSEKISKYLEPVIQIAASFPGTLLFPILVLFFQYAGISLYIGSIVLMLLGTQWYILFNVLAGAKAMPSDLKEAAIAFKWKNPQKFLHLYLPAIFPYLVTGLVTAAGGAWSTSIVAEYVSYKSQVLTIPGIGSMINLSAQDNNIPVLVASMLVMAAVVALLNYQGWLRLYHYSEKRFSLNY